MFRAGDWHILFRRAFSVQGVGSNTSENNEIIGNGNDNDNIISSTEDDGENKNENSTIANTNSTKSDETPTFVTAILHVSDASLSAYIVVVDHDTGEEHCQPSLHTNPMALEPNTNGYSLLVAAYSRCVCFSDFCQRE